MRTFVTGENGLMFSDKWTPRCWINVECPDTSDIDYLLDDLLVPEAFLKDIEDSDERPRIEYEDDWQIIIMRIPIKDLDHGQPYSTVPLGIILKDNIIISICYHKTEMIDDFITYNRRKNIGFSNKYDLVLKLMLSSSVWFLKYLKQLNAGIKESEKELEKSIKNSELHTLLQFEKCFVFFITALKGNDILLHRIKTNRFIQDMIDMDLVEDVEIEMKQALETANVHSDILSGMMDAYASVISNNMNDIMKQLTLISIILMIPTLIASFFGMNIPNGLENSNFAFVGIVLCSLIVSICGVLIFRWRKWF